MPRSAIGLVLLTGVALLTGTPTASACPMCLSGPDEAREAYYATTALMIAVPVLLWTSIGYWLYRASRRGSADARPTPDRKSGPPDRRHRGGPDPERVGLPAGS